MPPRSSYSKEKVGSDEPSIADVAVTEFVAVRLPMTAAARSRIDPPPSIGAATAVVMSNSTGDQGDRNGEIQSA
jgi:hypothetical protein